MAHLNGGRKRFFVSIGICLRCAWHFAPPTRPQDPPAYESTPLGKTVAQQLDPGAGWRMRWKEQPYLGPAAPVFNVPSDDLDLDTRYPLFSPSAPPVPRGGILRDEPAGHLGHSIGAPGTATTAPADIVFPLPCGTRSRRLVYLTTSNGVLPESTSQARTPSPIPQSTVRNSSLEIGHPSAAPWTMLSRPCGTSLLESRWTKRLMSLHRRRILESAHHCFGFLD